MVLLPHKYSVDYYHFHDTEPKARLRMHMHDNINFFKLRSMAVFLRMYICASVCVGWLLFAIRSAFFLYLESN